MPHSTLLAIEWLSGLACSGGFVLGLLSHRMLVVSAASVGLCFLIARASAPLNWRGLSVWQEDEQDDSQNGDPRADTVDSTVDACDGELNTDGLVKQMLSQHRYCLLLRPQIADTLSDEHIRHALSALEEGMSLVPEGTVVLRPTEPAPDVEQRPGAGQIISVSAVLLDRYQVTNRQYRQFVQAGGYEETALWDTEVLNTRGEFVDQTGEPGPRFWADRNYPVGEGDHPVVGINYYEASAYARWVGKRLPTDAEWVKAGSWPVSQEAGVPLSRRFPWGDAMDRQRANLWGSGPGRTVAVRDYDDGQSVGGIYQLVGNVWEWTATSFGIWNARPNLIETSTPMKSIRGGAFDTYFDNHASCHFQSGENPLARRHNVGFRCALGVCDLQSPEPQPEPSVECAAGDDPLELITADAASAANLPVAVCEELS